MPTPLPSRRRLLPLLALVIACGGEDRIQAPSLAADPAVMIALPGATFHPRRVRDGSVPQFSYCSGSCPTDSTMVDFEGGWAPGFTPVDSQYAALGVVFGNAVVGETTDSFYNDPEYPPRSGSALAAADFTSTGDWSGTLSLALDTSAVRVRGYITSFSPVTLQCFNVADSLLAESVFPGANLALLHGGPPNQPVEVSAAGIRRCQFLGPNAQYTLDDLTVVWVAPLPTLACDTVVRGAMGTCAVTGADSVLQWRFRGVLDSASRLIHTDSVVADTSLVPDTTWSGTAVLSGAVSALVRYGPGSDTLTLTAPWDVQPRTGSAWRWGPTDWKVEKGNQLPADCNYADLIFPPDTILTLGNNRRRRDCEETGSIEPNPTDPATVDGASTVASDTAGPNRGLWYVVSSTWGFDRISELNPWIRGSLGPKLKLATQVDYNDCDGKVVSFQPDSILVTFTQFNEKCQSFSLEPMISALWKHEGFGTRDSLDPAVANGHEARRHIAARNIANDPRALTEPLVAKASAAVLRILIANVVDAADKRISAFSSDDSGLVKDNYLDPAGGCGRAWVLTKPPPLGYNLYRLASKILVDSTLRCF